MRELTDEERDRLERRRTGLDQFVQESFPVLADFIERLELPQPQMVLREAEKYLSALDSWMRNQVLAPEDRVWSITRFAYFIGELLNQRLGGYWFVDDHPESPYFAQYVVGHFTGIPSINARISPLGLAANYVDEPAGRSLVDVVTRAEEQLRQCTSSEP